MRLINLNNRHRQKMFRLLMKNVNTNIFLIEILMRRGIVSWGFEEWRGLMKGEDLLAISLSMARVRNGEQSRLVVAYGNQEACSVLGKRERELGGTKMIIGDRTASDGIWEGMGKPKPRINYAQRLMSCVKPAEGQGMKLRYAKPEDLELLSDYAAEMMLEDLKIDPRREEPEIHKKGVFSRIKNQKTLVGEEGGEICFVLDVGTCFRMGAQVGGTYVPPKFRGRGLGTMGMREACRLLLRDCECVTLHVNEENTAAMRCYDKAGFKSDSPFRLIAFHNENRNA